MAVVVVLEMRATEASVAMLKDDATQLRSLAALQNASAARAPKYIAGMRHEGARLFWLEFSAQSPRIPWTEFVDYFAMHFTVANAEGEYEISEAHEQLLRQAIDTNADGVITSLEFDKFARKVALGDSWAPPPASDGKAPLDSGADVTADAATGKPCI